MKDGFLILIVNLIDLIFFYFKTFSIDIDHSMKHKDIIV